MELTGTKGERSRAAQPVTAIALLVAIALAVVGCSPADTATDPAPSGIGTIGPQTRARVIDAALKALGEDYVFSDVAREMQQAIREHQRRGDYEDLTFVRFAERLTEDLQRVSRDKHLHVDYFPAREASGQLPGPSGDGPPHGPVNFGISLAVRLQGNVGLITMRGFAPLSPGAKDAIAEAMNTVHATDSLIFDMRRNFGGDPRMVALVCSYLVGPQPVELSSLYGRGGELMEEIHTSKQVRGQRYLDKDVYILTSARTFSGGEAFAYDLKHLNRATIIGEKTGGGAHPSRPVHLPGGFTIMVPHARAINPITETNWEGRGVIPEIAVPADRALDAALRAARN